MISPLRRIAIVALLLIVTPAPAVAWNAPQIISTSCELRHEVSVMTSPIPGWCWWQADPAAGSLFDATTGDGDGTYCENLWRVHCSDESLDFEGQWPDVESSVVYGIMYLVEMSCELRITSPTLLTANASFSGALDRNEHSVTLVFPDLQELVLVDTGGTTGDAELTLEPGDYQIRIFVDAYKSEPAPAYNGQVSVHWMDPGVLPVQSRSWDAIKATYLH